MFDHGLPGEHEQDDARQWRGVFCRSRRLLLPSEPLRSAVATFEKPRPRPPKAQPAFEALCPTAREALAEGAHYVGSPHHTDVPKYGSPANPRSGFTTIEDAEEEGLKNPSCLVCPRKGVRRQDDATELVRKAIREGTFIPEGEHQKPSRLWARDPDDCSLVYEAKLSAPQMVIKLTL
jgi:hypothetical protein